MNAPNSTQDLESNQHVTAQMSRHQRGLVDISFEEGHYDSGIAVLDQLRSPDYAPSASHIRQLLYIALYPPQSKDKPLDPHYSPSKVSRQRSQLGLSPETIASAQALLMSFVYTNDPRVISRALPSFDEQYIDNSEDDADSFVAQESLRINRSQSCWNILSKRFIPRVVVASPTKSKGRRRRSAVEDEDTDFETDASTSSPVAENAWPILEWLITIFERDEQRTEASFLPRHSPLLLTQIPPPRTGSGARWEVHVPLAIILHALGQTGDERRRSMGGRLLSLLINLTSTVHFDFTVFVTLVFNQISTSTSQEQEFLALLATLPPSQSVLNFKVALLYKFVSTNGKGTRKAAPRPKPQVRARPTRGGEDEPKTGGYVNPEASLSSISSNPLIPTSVDIIQSIKLQPKTTSTTELSSGLWIKFLLLLSYGELQNQIPADARDEGWIKLLRSGEFAQQLETIFPLTEDGTGDAGIYQGMLKSLATNWVL